MASAASRGPSSGSKAPSTSSVQVSDVHLASFQSPVQQQSVAQVATAAAAASSAEATASGTSSGPQDMVPRPKTTVEAMGVSAVTSTPKASRGRRGATGHGKPTKPKAPNVMAPLTDPAT